jgi:tRNA A-37 threonylcarbamoyl transferase component Bud32
LNRCWQVAPEFGGSKAEAVFSSLDAVFELEGENVTRDSISDVIRVEISGHGYYVKRYYRRGNGIGQWLGRSKVQGEWKNLLFFQELGLPIPPVVAYGQKGRRGALITEEVPGTADLSAMANGHSPCLDDPVWVLQVMIQVARAARKMHGKGFAHNDLKWRNILVNTRSEPNICLIDCPSGRFWRQPFLEYRIVKDLACLDKVARRCLTLRQRLKFYQLYTGRKVINVSDRRRLRKIDRFFADRE